MLVLRALTIIFVLILDQKEDPQAHPTLNLDDETMKTPSKTPTMTPGSGRKPPSGRRPSLKKSQQVPLTVTTAATVTFGNSAEVNEGNVNKLLPCLLELDEEGHCFVTGLHKEESLLCLLS
jgi:hypothetical protein